MRTALRVLLRLCAVTGGSVAAVLLWSLISGASASAATPPSSPPAPACPDVQVIAVPGTGETNQAADPHHPVGMLAQVSQPLQKSLPGRVDTWYVPYVATAAPMGGGATYADSKAQAVSIATTKMAHTAATCTHTRFALTGYSQGAAAAGDLAAQIGHAHGPIPATKLVAVGLISDPNRAATGETLVGAPAPGTGLAGARPGGFGTVTNRVVTLCAPTDLFCATPPSSTGTAIVGRTMSTLSTAPDSPLGQLLRATSSPQAAIQALQQLGVHDLPTLITTLQRVLSPATMAQVGDLLHAFTPDAVHAQISAYASFMASGVHGSYTSLIVDGQGHTGTQWLTQWMHNQLTT